MKLITMCYRHSPLGELFHHGREEVGLWISRGIVDLVDCSPTCPEIQWTPVIVHPPGC